MAAATFSILLVEGLVKRERTRPRPITAIPIRLVGEAPESDESAEADEETEIAKATGDPWLLPRG